jgi:hypothetical protein
MVANYERKFQYLWHHQHGRCPIAWSEGWFELPTELHHRAHRTKWARRRFPLFIDSVWNLMAVAHDWHMRYPSFGKISWLEAERREQFLERHPAIARAVNMEDRNE